jgi:hypothetical protein
MKSLVEKKYPKLEELNNLSIDELLKYRFFHLRGSIGKKMEIRDQIDKELINRHEEWTLDNLSHFLAVKPIFDFSCSATKAQKRMGKTLLRMYNLVLYKLVPYDHPNRYKYVENKFLNKLNISKEFMAWTIGNSHEGPNWDDTRKCVDSYISQANTEELNQIAELMISNKVREAASFVVRDDLQSSLKKRLLKFDFIDISDIRHAYEITIDSDFIDNLVNGNKRFLFFQNLGYEINYTRNVIIKINNKLSYDNIKQILFPFMQGKYSLRVHGVLNNFKKYYERK